MENKDIGLLGVGRMGKQMLIHLMANGYQVHAYDPYPSAMEFAAAHGAKSYDCPRRVAQNAHIILLSLPKPQHVFEVISGERGLFASLCPHHILVDTSTVSPQTSKECAKRIGLKQASYVDAPVLGRPSAAGKWFLPAGGKEKAIQTVTPVLMSFAKNVQRVGDTGAGNTLKLLNQLMFSVINAVSTEVMTLTRKTGIDPEVFYEVVSQSGAATVSGLFLEVGRKIVDKSYEDPSFTIELLIKDAGLGIQMAEELGVFPFVSGYVQMLNENACMQGLGKQDTSALSKLFQKMYGITDEFA